MEGDALDKARQRFLGLRCRGCAYARIFVSRRRRRLRRSHLLLDPLNCTSPGPKHLGDLQDANILLELLLCLAFQCLVEVPSGSEDVAR